jgi:hypothetical protein
MTTTHFSQSTNGLALDTAIAGTSLNGLTNTSYAIGAAINNTPTDGTTISYDLADFTMTLSSAVTTGSGSVYLSIYLLPLVDATNYPTPPGATAGAAPTNYLVGTYQGVASTSTSTISVLNLPIPPYSFKIMIQNNLGVTLPATNTSTCQIQRKTVANW